MPHSSLYCVQKSASRASPAARNLKIAASPAVSLPLEPPVDCAHAFVPRATKPAPTPAPATVSPALRKLRRSPLLNRLGSSFILILFQVTVPTALLLHFRREMIEHSLHVRVELLDVLVGFVG